jgi:hypothetical protein
VCDDQTYQNHSWNYKPDEKESCYDQQDNDCDGKADFEDDADCCQAKCDGKQCGDDGCGGSCGTCPEGKADCVAGMCEAKCGGYPSSSCNGGYCGKQYGTGGCFCDGYNCEMFPDSCCPDYKACCGGACTPACTGKECGPDGCDGTCGSCAADETCTNGQCTGGGGLTECKGSSTPSAAGCALAQDDIGCCTASNWVVWCDGTNTYCIACAGQKPTCGWNASAGYYDCGTSAGSDPSGDNPRVCP